MANQYIFNTFAWKLEISNEGFGLSSACHTDHSDMGCDVCEHEGAAATRLASDGDISSALHRCIPLHLDDFPPCCPLAVFGRRGVVLCIGFSRRHSVFRSGEHRHRPHLRQQRGIHRLHGPAHHDAHGHRHDEGREGEHPPGSRLSHGTDRCGDGGI